VITTVQADNLISAVASLAKWAAQAIGDDPARQMLANALRLVVHQTLIRRRPSIEWINLPAGDKTAARAKIRTGRFDQLVDEVDLQHFQRNARNG
jgi:Tfp pilus assembly pilus retraction ATPase PilT